MAGLSATRIGLLRGMQQKIENNGLISFRIK